MSNPSQRAAQAPVSPRPPSPPISNAVASCLHWVRAARAPQRSRRLRWPARLSPPSHRGAAVRRKSGISRDRAHPRVLRHDPNLGKRGDHMLLTKKASNVRTARPALRQTRDPAVGTMDRRAFLKRSGMAAGAGAFASNCLLDRSARAQAAAKAGTPRQDGKETHRSARIVRSAARSMPRCRTACGSARSRRWTARSISARIAPRARRSANSCIGDIAA